MCYLAPIRAVFFVTIMALFVVGCSKRQEATEEQSRLLFSKGVKVVLSAERIIETSVRFENVRDDKSFGNMLDFTVHSEACGTFESWLLYPEKRGRPVLGEGKLYNAVIYQKRAAYSADGGKIVIPESDFEKAPPKDAEWINTILKITDGDVVVLDRSVCELHKCAMNFVQAKISYGYPDGYFYENAREKFPNGYDWISGGCVPTTDIVDRKFLCPKCSEAYYEWRSEEAKSGRARW